MRIKVLVCVSVLAAVLASCRNAPEQSAEAASKVKAESARKPAPNFTLKDADGKPVTLADFKGKVVLLNFWATWCGPCKIEIPWFIEFEQKYKDRGFAVLGVSMDEEGWEVVKPYLAQNKINYRVAVGDDSLAQLYGGVESLPTTFIIDGAGRIASTHVGLVSKSDYENEIVELLESRRATLDGAVRVASAARADKP